MTKNEDDLFKWLEFFNATYWSLRVHEDQSYFGRAVFWLRRPGTMQRIHECTASEFEELRVLLKRYERVLEKLSQPKHMNYAWLGNYFQEHGGHGHMHVIPRYNSSDIVKWRTLVFTDTRWGRDYKPRTPRTLPKVILEDLVVDLRQRFIAEN